jgi:hypothetical protein
MRANRRGADVAEPHSSRRAWLTNTSTYSVRVCTVRKSAAQSVGRWLRRKVRQLWLGGLVGPRRR